MGIRAKDAGEQAGRAAAAMRRVLEDARDALDELEAYVDSWDEAAAEARAEGAEAAKSLLLTETYVVERALGHLAEVEHMPTGGTRHMHLREARSELMALHKMGA